MISWIKRLFCETGMIYTQLGNRLRKNDIALLARILIMVTALAAFLPYKIAGCVVTAIGLVFCVLPGTRDKIFVHKGSLVLLIFTLTTAIVALFYGNYLGLLRTGVFAAMMVICHVARAIMTKRFFEKLLDCICLGGSASSLGAIIERIMHRNVSLYRCKAFFVNPNFLGAALMLVILICAYKAVVRAKSSFLFYIIAILNAVGLYLCGSMGLWFIVLIGISLLLILNHEYKMMLVFFGIAIAALVAIIMIPALLPRLNELGATTNNRIKIWNFAIEQIREAPIFGRGFFSYKHLYNELSPVRPDIYKAALAHNVIIDSVLCHGFFGSTLAGAYIFQYIKTVLYCHDELKLRSHRYVISTFIASVCIAVGCYGMIDTTLIWVQTGMLLLLISSGIGTDERELRHSIRAERSRALRENQLK